MLRLENIPEWGMKQLNDSKNFLSYQCTEQALQFLNEPARTLAIFYGNQAGKNALVSYNYVARILGKHPVAKKNVLYFECDNKTSPTKMPNIFEGHTFAPYKVDNGNMTKCPICTAKLMPHIRKSRIFRFASERLPTQSEDTNEDGGSSAEVSNTQYPEFKKWLPPYLIKNDIVARNLSVIVYDPFGGDDIIVEFVSYGQTARSQKGVQRLSVWMDEEPPENFFGEQYPRIIMEDGDIIITYAPVEDITYLYDMIYERAKIYYRTKTVCEEYYKKVEKKFVPQIQLTGLNDKKDIAVFQAATSDNPMYKNRDVRDILGIYDDIDVFYMRFFGIFKAISGRIFKCFDPSIHVIDEARFFKDAA